MTVGIGSSNPNWGEELLTANYDRLNCEKWLYSYINLGMSVRAYFNQKWLGKKDQGHETTGTTKSI